MPQITTGLRAIFSSPAIYDICQTIMGASSGRRDFARNFIRAAPGDKILDVGCGPADILQCLPAVQYWGYDVSAAYIAAAQARFGERGRFACRVLDEVELANLPRFDLVLAIGLLHHLEDELAEGFFLIAHRALRAGGRLVTVDPCYADDQSWLARFLIRHDRGQNVRAANGYLTLARASFPEAVCTVRHRAWIPYTHCIVEAVA